MRPPVPYFGGKQTLADKIVAQFPVHGHYVEPFAGSLAVLLAKPPSKIETVNDLDGELVNFWRVLRDQPHELARVCELTPHSRSEHAKAQTPAQDDVERARRVWVQLTQGRNGTRRASGTGWRYAKDPTATPITNYLTTFTNRILPAAERLRSVTLECRPAIDVIRGFGDYEDVLIYADPPYVGTTRGWGNNYAVEMRSDDEHRELADALSSAKAAVVLSGYASPLYLDLYRNWRCEELSAFTAQSTDGDRTEVLWINRVAQDVLDFGGAA